MFSRLIQNRWALVPVLMLSFTITAAIVILTFAFSDSNVTAVEPDYYRKALAWDDYRKQLAENGVLGWVVTSTFVAGQNDPTLARLELTVADKYGVNIEHARVRVECIPILAANSRISTALQEISAGHYAADVPLRVNGMWEIRATVEAKNHLYCDRFRRHLSFGKPRPAKPVVMQDNSEIKEQVAKQDGATP